MTQTRAAVELEAANGALALLGEARLSSINESRPAARAINDSFGGVRDALLRKHPWNFALAWQSLAEDPLLAEGSFPNGFPLPSDCLRVRGVAGLTEADWSVETAQGDQSSAIIMPILFTSATTVLISYTRRVENVVLWDPLFLEIFEMELAAKIAAVLGRGPDADNLRATAKQALATARRIDEREASRSTVRRDVSYITVRR